MKKIVLPYNVELREYQKKAWNAFFKDKFRHHLLIWHRRAGKSKLSVNIIAAASQQRVGAYYYLFPQLKQARTAIWEGRGKDGIPFRDHFPKAIVKHVDNSEMKIVFKNGSIFRLLGTDKGSYDRMMGTNPIGVLYDEYAQHDPLARDYLLPILAENDGWEIIISTPRGHNHLYELYQTTQDHPDWFINVLTINDTKREDGSPIVDKSTLDGLQKSGWSDDKIEQEFYCSFEAANRGAYFSRQLKAATQDARIKDFPIDTSLPIYTYWDLGYRDATSIWIAQHYRDEIRLIAYYENNNEALSHYINWLKDFRDRHNVTFGKHFGPHDVENKSLGTGKSTKELAFELGFRFEPRIKRIEQKQAAIEMARNVFSRCYFHKTNTKRGLDCLREYHKQYNESMGTFSDRPVHNWASHGADAFMTLAQAVKERPIGVSNARIQTDHILSNFG